MARCVLCYRALNGRSGTRLGRAERHLAAEPADGAFVCRGDAVPGGVFTAPAGLLAPVQVMALWAQRYAHVHGLGQERLSRALGSIAVTQRRYAQTNPRALTCGVPLSMDEYLDARMIASPLRLYDVCRETDGAAAILVAGDDAGEGRGVRVVAAAQQLFAHSEPLPIYTPDITRLTSEPAVDELFAAAAIPREAIDVALIYDATTIAPLLTLEDFGFVARGGAEEFLASGQHGPGGRLPINPHGGLLSEGYVHGMNAVVEAVEQLRNEAHNQVAGAAHALVTARGASLILGAPT
jgi:acetyl-CoA acetyltransferase